MQINSATDALERFSTEEAARKYNQALVYTRKDLREQKSIELALRNVPEGARVLDFPCGTGRLTATLSRMNYLIISADSSWHMTKQARENSESRLLAGGGFSVMDILNTAFKEDSFDAVICNRLFHHFFEPAIRMQALKELGRICSGTIIVSYFSTRCIDAITSRLKHFLKGKQPRDRVPIAPELFIREIESSGLKIQREIPSRPYISMQTYVVLNRAT